MDAMTATDARWTKGYWVGVPLRDGRWGAGMIARGRKNGILLGYFYGPWNSCPSLDDVTGLSPQDALLVRRFGSMGIRDGEWPIIGKQPRWKPEEWPQPEFFRQNGTFLRAVSYDDKNKGGCERRLQEGEPLPRWTDGFWGHIALISSVEGAITGSVRPNEGVVGSSKGTV
jgi:hypothetical protein